MLGVSCNNGYSAWLSTSHLYSASINLKHEIPAPGFLLLQSPRATSRRSGAPTKHRKKLRLPHGSFQPFVKSTCFTSFLGSRETSSPAPPPRPPRDKSKAEKPSAKPSFTAYTKRWGCNPQRQLLEFAGTWDLCTLLSVAQHLLLVMEPRPQPIKALSPSLGILGGAPP